jgi:branched-chain amino acid transport system substrate-binding protein
VGPHNTAEAYALLPVIDAQKIPTLSPTVAAEDLTQRRRSPWIVRTGWSAGQPAHPFGKWVHDTLGHRRIAGVLARVAALQGVLRAARPPHFTLS